MRLFLFRWLGLVLTGTTDPVAAFMAGFPFTISDGDRRPLTKEKEAA
jgi:hypothetical protein